ncbi:hypothetical protein [Microbulbifer epialgicus]|uniref:Uncharacterized protein n=1 Tax=Microbulbifer epialgicus TaxID=393907 RepID=A0ABV4P7J4_9GAMM
MSDRNYLNGRKTLWDNTFRVGRNGVDGLIQVTELRSPLKWGLLMLGTNDFQDTHDNKAWMAAQGGAKLMGTSKNSLFSGKIV